MVEEEEEVGARSAPARSEDIRKDGAQEPQRVLEIAHRSIT
jgi:hypothetical protein